MISSHVIERLFYSEGGRMVVSVILAMGLAMLFRRVCHGKHCIVLKVPPMDEIAANAYDLEGDCYKYHPVAVKCTDDYDVVT